MVTFLAGIDRAAATAQKKLGSKFDYEVDEIAVQTRDHIKAYEELGLSQHANELNFEAKCALAEKNNLLRVSAGDIATMLFPETVGSYIEQPLTSGLRLEYFYDPFFKRGFKGQRMPLFRCWAKQPGWWKWQSIDMVPLDALRCAIPYGILLKVIELKQLNFFNCFLAFAPTQLVREGAFVAPASVDPVVVGTLTHGHMVNFRNDQDSQVWFHGCTFAHFFIGKW